MSEKYLQANVTLNLKSAAKLYAQIGIPKWLYYIVNNCLLNGHSLAPLLGQIVLIGLDVLAEIGHMASKVFSGASMRKEVCRIMFTRHFDNTNTV